MSSTPETTSSVGATVRGCFSLIVVLGLVLFITNGFRKPELVLGYTFSGTVSTATTDQVCLVPDRNAFSWALRWWFALQYHPIGAVSTVCAEVALDGFQPLLLQSLIPSKCIVQRPCPLAAFNSPALVGKRVQATLAWRTNANGDRVKTFLVLRQEP